MLPRKDPWGGRAGEPLTVSVVICAYTEDRWSLLLQSVASVQEQSRPPVEIIVCVDHNRALLERCRLQWADDAGPFLGPGGGDRQQVRRSSRFCPQSAAEVARGDIVAFLDDDAWADPDWLERLVSPYATESVVAVGGAPIPAFERPGPTGSLRSSTGCSVAPMPAFPRRKPRSEDSSGPTCRSAGRR